MQPPGRPPGTARPPFTHPSGAYPLVTQTLTQPAVHHTAQFRPQWPGQIGPGVAPPPPARPMPVTPHRPPAVPGLPGAPQATAGRVPSGLFPGKSAPRPSYRELLPVGPGRAAIGVLAGTLWMGLFGLMATSARAYAWWSIVAALLALPVLVVLTRFGDRGVAAGAAVSTGFGLALAGLVVTLRWIGGDWLLW
jgi:hypothetical protein